MTAPQSKQGQGYVDDLAQTKQGPGYVDDLA